MAETSSDEEKKSNDLNESELQAKLDLAKKRLLNADAALVVAENIAKQFEAKLGEYNNSSWFGTATWALCSGNLEMSPLGKIEMSPFGLGESSL